MNSPPAKLPAWQLLPVFVLSLLVLCGLIGWLQNVHIVTSNGMYKSIQAEPWIADWKHARLDQSNYLYFPLYGLLCRVLDALGILRGVAWKQLAYLNAFFASIASVLVYAFAWRLSGSVRVAAAATLFHLGTGFVLLLSVISEDIMPGYVVVLAAMMLAGLWFDRPTHLRVACVGALFTVGWLIEWRLIFPTTPALLLAIAVSDGTLRRRCALGFTLIVSIVATAGIVQQMWEGHNGAVGLHDLLWTGKGVTTGWGGFTWDKPWLLLSGLAGYVSLYAVEFTAAAARANVVALILPVLIGFAILAACVGMLWPRRHDRRLRAVAAVFLGTFAAGEVFNLYAQPQDPQMQINVMVWLTVAWILLLAATLDRPRLSAVVIALSAVPLVWNAVQLLRERGRDAAAVAAVADLAKHFPPQSTVFVYFGFEAITMWHYALWSHDWDFDGAADLAPAPSDKPLYKWIALDAGAIRHPGWTPEQNAAAIRHDIDQALDRGYRVVASDVWLWTEQELANQLGTLSATNRAPALYAAMHAYKAEKVYDAPPAGSYYELTRK
jgi:hypothetical protein